MHYTCLLDSRNWRGPDWAEEKRRRHFLQLRTHIASQLARFHPNLRKTLWHNLAELVTATALARHVHLAEVRG